MISRPFFLTSGVAHLTEIREDQECKFHEYLKHEQFSNWFTVPIKESDADSLGICVIGYRKIVPFVVDNSVEKLFFGIRQRYRDKYRRSHP